MNHNNRGVCNDVKAMDRCCEGGGGLRTIESDRPSK